MAITYADPIRHDGRLVPGTPARFAATLAQPLPEGQDATLRIAGVKATESDADAVTVTMDVDAGRTLLSATLTAEQVATILGETYTVGYAWARYRITTGTGDALLALFSGQLAVKSKWDGVQGQALTAAASESQAAQVAANAAQDARDIAEAARDAAASSALSAASSASSAASSASAASGSASSASASKDAAALSETAAAGSAATATTKAGEASASASDAAASAATALSQTWAGASMGADTDLNSKTTAGIFYQATGANATLVLNYPVASLTGILRVYTRGAANQVVQEYAPLSSTQRVIYQRRNVGGTWTSWRAMASHRVDQTAGRAIYAWDDLNDREQLIYGDTGWRDVTAAGWLANGWTASALYVSRSGYDIILHIEGLNAASMTNIAFITLPAGYQISGTVDRRGLLHTATTPANAYRTLANTVVSATTSTPLLYGVLRWRTLDAWPTSLPGTAVGSIGNL